MSRHRLVRNMNLQGGLIGLCFQVQTDRSHDQMSWTMMRFRMEETI